MVEQNEWVPQYYLDETEAVVVARSLIHFNRYLLGEFEKIARSGDEVSDLIKEAARKQYQELSEPVTLLHMALAEKFPSLRQP